VDVYETPEATLLLVDVPGVETDKIDLSITGKLLTLRGVREAEELPGAAPSVRERKVGPFHRVVEIPSSVDVDAIQASAKNGVLTIRLPKRTAGKSRTIPIQPS
jgi:HSP20 family protein